MDFQVKTENMFLHHTKWTKKTYCFLPLALLNLTAQALLSLLSDYVTFFEVCPGLNANKIQIPYNKHHNTVQYNTIYFLLI